MRREIAERKAAFGTWRCARERLRDAQIERECAMAVEAERQLEIEHAALELKAELTALRFKLVWAELGRKAGFNPSQPRVPKGNPDGGQWTDGSTGASINDARVISDATPDNEAIPGGQYAANKTNTPRGIGDNVNKFPEIPKDPPPTAKERNAIARDVARRLAVGAILVGVRSGGRVAAATVAAVTGAYGAHWLYDQYNAHIEAYRGPAKTAQELREAARSPRDGYDIHHAVERAAALKDGFPKSRVDGADNLYLVPRWKHWEITGWYMTQNPAYGGLTPRQYLRGKSWEERERVGHDALRKFGVLK